MKKTPTPGQAVRGSTTGRPIMVALDLLGRRTALRILWELRSGPLTSRALLEACESNSRLMHMRLSEFRDVGLIEHTRGGYQLTEEGHRLRQALQPMMVWAEQWAATQSAPQEPTDA